MSDFDANDQQAYDGEDAVDDVNNEVEEFAEANSTLIGIPTNEIELPDNDAVEVNIDAEQDIPVLERIAPEPTPILRSNDREADADLARPSRVITYRQQRRSQFSMTIPAILMIMLGALFLANNLTSDPTNPIADLGLLTPLTAVGATVAAISLGLVARFMINGRRELGLMFIALTLVFWLALGAVVASGVLPFAQAWPLFISAVGLAVLPLLMFTRERPLLLTGLFFLITGLALLPFTMGFIDTTSVNGLVAYWPIIPFVLALMYLPRAFRKSQG